MVKELRLNRNITSSLKCNVNFHPTFITRCLVILYQVVVACIWCDMKQLVCSVYLKKKRLCCMATLFLKASNVFFFCLFFFNSVSSSLFCWVQQTLAARWRPTDEWWTARSACAPEVNTTTWRTWAETCTTTPSSRCWETGPSGTTSRCGRQACRLIDWQDDRR